MKSLAVVALLALLAAPAAGAAGLEPYLVKDLNPEPTAIGSNPSFPVTLGDAVLFFADDGLTGRELWRSDGTAAGTWQLSDAGLGELPDPVPFQVTERLFFFLSGHPVGTASSLWVSDGTRAGTFRLSEPGVRIVPWLPVWVAGQGVLYFVASDEEHGDEPWRSDGTPAGTWRIADVRPGPEGSGARGMVEYRGRIWFGAGDGQRGGALWSTDGTEAGTVLAVDPFPATAFHGVPEFLSVVGNRLLFFTPPPGGGASRRLWAGDGTQQGTVPLQAFSGAGGGGTSAVPDAVVQGNRLYFIARDRKGQELWVSDGTVRGTRALTAFARPDAFISDHSLLALPRQPGVGGRFVFPADDGPRGVEPWITDGTPQGTRLLRDVCAGACASDPGLGAVLGGRLYFSANSFSHGIELWSTDGTRTGTRRVRDICPGDCSSFPYPIVAVGNRLLFPASDREHGRELWASDGTAAGTVRISDFTPEYLWPDGFSGAVLDGRLLFAVDDGEHGNELWIADGTSEGTRLVADLNRVDVGGSFPGSLMPFGSQVVFAVLTFGESALWKSDGTEAGTVLIRTFGPDEPDGATPLNVYAEAGGLLFYVSGGGLWRTDGTAAGTFPLADRAASSCCIPAGLRAVGSTVFFELGDEPHGFELWASDGTVAGTRLVLDILPGAQGSTPRELTAFQGRLWFTADSPGAGRELWTSDGTAAGTALLADLAPGSASSAPKLLTVHAGRLWFFATDGLYGRELWSSDGTAAGTRLEVDVTPGSGSSPEPQILASLGDRLVFSFPGGGLWVSDGTAAGTRKIHERELDFPADRSTVFRGRLWFGSQGRLWSTDGTEAGTGPVLDRDGNGISSPYRFAVLGDRLVFTAYGFFGPTLFESDGTPAGTFAVEPWVAIRSVLELAGAGERVFFPGYDPATGWELWAVRP